MSARDHRPSSVGLIVRALALGTAAGSRGSLGVAAPLLAAGPGRAPSPPGAVRVATLAAVVGELVGDKLPRTPSRLDPPGPLFRVASGAVGGVLLARRRSAGRAVTLAAAVGGAVGGAIGAAAGTWGGAAWRRLAVGTRPDWPGAVAEDAVALALAAWAVRR